jgi:hypothetical protein
LEQEEDLRLRAYWGSCVVLITPWSALRTSNPAVPIYGHQVDHALTYAVAAAEAMVGHPDPAQRWANDSVLYHERRIVALVRSTLTGAVTRRYHPDALTPTEAASEELPQSLHDQIGLVDGRYGPAFYINTTALANRDLTTVLDQMIDNACRPIPSRSPQYRRTSDLAFSFRGQVLVIIRRTTSGSIVERFDWSGDHDVTKACSSR